MKKKLIIAASVLLLLIGCDVLSCLNLKNNDWKHDGGPRIGDFIYLDSCDDFFSLDMHAIKCGQQTKGYLIVSIDRTALLYITDGKDQANKKGFAWYTRL